jgi:hypothetical protein
MDEHVISKVCNALIPDAEADIDFHVSKGLKKWFGGLWVGGNLTISETGLSFKPNSLNSALHSNDCSVDIPFSELRSARKEFGFVTGIVVVSHAGGEFRFRCFGASNVAAAINSLLNT